MRNKSKKEIREERKEKDEELFPTDQHLADTHSIHSILSE